MWGDEEDDDVLQCDCDQWLKRDLQKPAREVPKSAENVDGCVLVKPGFAQDAAIPEEQMMEEDLNHCQLQKVLLEYRVTNFSTKAQVHSTEQQKGGESNKSRSPSCLSLDSLDKYFQDDFIEPMKTPSPCLYKSMSERLMAARTQPCVFTFKRKNPDNAQNMANDPKRFKNGKVPGSSSSNPPTPNPFKGTKVGELTGSSNPPNPLKGNKPAEGTGS
nr:uncharacterized protein LOC110084887 [Pogona vitticeps]